MHGAAPFVPHIFAFGLAGLPRATLPALPDHPDEINPTYQKLIRNVITDEFCGIFFFFSLCILFCRHRTIGLAACERKQIRSISERYQFGKVGARGTWNMEYGRWGRWILRISSSRLRSYQISLPPASCVLHSAYQGRVLGKTEYLTSWNNDWKHWVYKGIRYLN